MAASKEVVGTPINNGDGSYTMVYHIRLENFGDTDLTNVQVVENLQTTFAAATNFTIDHVIMATQPSSPWIINGAFDGNTNDEILNPAGDLNIGEVALIEIELTVVPGATLTYNNSVSVTSETPNGASSTDVSQNGGDPDPDGNGDPGDNNEPTPVTFNESPQIGLAKDLGPMVTNNGDGTYSIQYIVRVENSGDVDLTNVQITDDLSVTFPGLALSNVSVSVLNNPASSTFTANAGYDGSSDINLLSGSNSLAVGEYANLSINLIVALNGSLGPFNNTADAVGTSPSNVIVTDTSQDGNDPDPEGDGPGDNSEPTPVAFIEKSGSRCG